MCCRESGHEGMQGGGHLEVKGRGGDRGDGEDEEGVGK